MDNAEKQKIMDDTIAKCCKAAAQMMSISGIHGCIFSPDVMKQFVLKLDYQEKQDNSYHGI